MRAWKGIQELPPTDPHSFFVLGGFHGEPFRGPGASTSAWWGGYCQHGTVLFPTWHRAYLYSLEEALRSIPGCEQVTLPFWDECSQESQSNGIPRALTDSHWLLDGERIKNPLRSFVLPMDIVDSVTSDQGNNPNSPNYSKPKGYETVRYPLSGLVGTAEDRKATQEHNAGFPNDAANVKTLDANIMAWLTMTVRTDGKDRGMVIKKFKDCLKAPTYTLFSNTTSQNTWNKVHPVNPVTSLESPHNYIHLAVGGFDIPTYRASPIAGANGDMGENDTAALDPIFYFHHCFIDYVFWQWQRRNKSTDSLVIDQQDPGAYYSSDSPPPAGANQGDQLTLQSPLLPFSKDDGSMYTSADCINIETQLGYSYDRGSLDEEADAEAPSSPAFATDQQPWKTIQVSGIDRSKIPGSFIIAAYAQDETGVHRLVGADAVLSRWTVQGCANCQSRLRAGGSFPLAADIPEKAIKVVLHCRSGAVVRAPMGTDGEPGIAMTSAGQLTSVQTPLDLDFQVAIV